MATQYNPIKCVLFEVDFEGPNVERGPDIVARRPVDPKKAAVSGQSTFVDYENPNKKSLHKKLTKNPKFLKTLEKRQNLKPDAANGDPARSTGFGDFKAPTDGMDGEEPYLENIGYDGQPVDFTLYNTFTRPKTPEKASNSVSLGTMLLKGAKNRVEADRHKDNSELTNALWNKKLAAAESSNRTSGQNFAVAIFSKLAETKGKTPKKDEGKRKKKQFHTASNSLKAILQKKEDEDQLRSEGFKVFKPEKSAKGLTKRALQKKVPPDNRLSGITTDPSWKPAESIKPKKLQLQEEIVVDEGIEDQTEDADDGGLFDEEDVEGDQAMAPMADDDKNNVLALNDEDRLKELGVERGQNEKWKKSAEFLKKDRKLNTGLKGDIQSKIRVDIQSTLDRAKAAQNPKIKKPVDTTIRQKLRKAEEGKEESYEGETNVKLAFQTKEEKFDGKKFLEQQGVNYEKASKKRKQTPTEVVSGWMENADRTRKAKLDQFEAEERARMEGHPRLGGSNSRKIKVDGLHKKNRYLSEMMSDGREAEDDFQGITGNLRMYTKKSVEQTVGESGRQQERARVNPDLERRYEEVRSRMKEELRVTKENEVRHPWIHSSPATTQLHKNNIKAESPSKTMVQLPEVRQDEEGSVISTELSSKHNQAVAFDFHERVSIGTGVNEQMLETGGARPQSARKTAYSAHKSTKQMMYPAEEEDEEESKIESNPNRSILDEGHRSQEESRQLEEEVDVETSVDKPKTAKEVRDEQMKSLMDAAFGDDDFDENSIDSDEDEDYTVSVLRRGGLQSPMTNKLLKDDDDDDDEEDEIDDKLGPNPFDENTVIKPYSEEKSKSAMAAMLKDFDDVLDY